MARATAADNLHYKTLGEAAELLRTKRLSPVELTQALLDRIELHDPDIGSFIALLAKRSLSQAREAEAEIMRGHWRGPLHGIPIALKDIFDSAFVATTAGMPIRAGAIAGRNATVVDRLEAAGAVILGTLALPEGIFVEHREPLPTPKNPWNPDFWTGASSSGCGAATAAGFCFGSLGSDTGGSIRTPSSACGVTGVKPTMGLVSRSGVFPLAETMDHVGPMARTAADAAAILGVIAGHDPKDRSTLGVSVPDYLAQIGGGLDGVTLGIDETLIAADADAEITTIVRRAARELERCGARLVPIALPSSDEIVASFFVQCAAQAIRAHAAYYPSRAESYGDQFRSLLELGARAHAADIADAQRRSRAYSAELTTLLGDIDLFITPVLLQRTPRADEVFSMLGGDYRKISRFQAPFNMTGHPTITLQGGFDSAGLPVGFQLVTRHFGEELLFRAGHAFQQVTDWHERHPDLTRQPPRAKQPQDSADATPQR